MQLPLNVKEKKSDVFPGRRGLDDVSPKSFGVFQPRFDRTHRQSVRRLDNDRYMSSCVELKLSVFIRLDSVGLLTHS